jgi:hypothetical protein
MRDAIHILDHGRPLPLHYEALLAYHGGGAMAGAAIGYCAMALAGETLSAVQVWDRKNLSVVSWHGGPGILDAIEFVTRTITRERFELRKDASAKDCGGASAFCFEVGDGARTAKITLKEEAVAPPFFELARLAERSAKQETELSRLKREVADAVMALPLHRLFKLTVAEPEPEPSHA